MLVLTFRVAEAPFAVAVAKIVEVIPRVELRPIPHAPDHLAGLLHYRGRAVPVVDLGPRLGRARCADRLNTRIILVEIGTKREHDLPSLLGMIAERVDEVREVAEAALGGFGRGGCSLPRGRLSGRRGSRAVDRAGLVALRIGPRDGGGAMIEDVEKLLAGRIGLDPATVGEELIVRGVTARMTHLGLIDRSEYEEILFHSEIEQQALVEEIVIPESWFFRDDRPFKFLRDQVQSGWVADPGRPPLRALSLPCANGEEPYSIAMSLLDAGLRHEPVSGRCRRCEPRDASPRPGPGFMG